eukprot:gb/GECG01014824.1/.p1 GENE.gb/GECG01014824.1/~~gb/GECG01014824.1/.p1  ORF type:complete len:2571 (+),score=263.34 gb/GECG01014824.1/:1-7713(+)
MTRSKSRQERIKDFGIDCGDGLEWGGGTWKPGGEYIKHLPVKNVSTKILKVRYKLPKTKFFSMEFPDPLRLAPGNEVLLEVRFRPIRLEEYDDFIEFYTEGGSFQVPVRARLSRLAVDVPQFLDVGLCPVNETVAKTVELSNVGEIAANYEWDVAAPFSIEPAKGEIGAGKKKTLTVYTHPQNANVFESTAICTIYGAPEKTSGTHGVSGPSKLVRRFHINAVGKYQFIMLETEVTDFGKVLISSEGTSHKRKVKLSNMSPVPATLTVKRLDDDRLPDFAISPKETVIPGYGTQDITLSYRPRVPGYYSCEKFLFLTPGGNVARLTVRALAQGPIVTLSRKDTAGSSTPRMRSTTFNFGDLYLPPTGNDAIGKKTSQKDTPIKTLVLTLRNFSGTTSYFSFDTSGLGVFRLSKTHGSIPPYLSTEVIVAFRPGAFGNYYRRLYCKIRDSSPLYADLLGTAYDDKQRPFPMKETHIDIYRLRPPAVKRLSAAELGSLMSTLQNDNMEELTFGEEDGTLGHSRHDTKSSTSRRSRPFILSVETLMSEREFRLKRPEFVIAENSKAVGAMRPTSSSLGKTLDRANTNGKQTTLPTEEIAEVCQTHNSDLSNDQLYTVTRSGETDRATCSLYSEIFGTSNGDAPLEVLENLLDFGAGSRTRINEKKSLHIRNNTRYKMSVELVVPVSTIGGTTGPLENEEFRNLYIDGAHNWHVSSTCFDVDAESTIEAVISFRPLTDDVYYSDELEIYATPKLNRSFRLVDEETFIPPYFCSVELRGHTFRTTEQFVPRLEPVLRYSCADGSAEDSLIKGVRDIQMPACFVGDSTFYTFELLNSGDTPATFRIETGYSHVFSVQPTSGKIEAGEFHLICIQFSPTHVRKFKENLKLIMNEDPNHAQQLAATGLGTSPALQLHNLPSKGTVYIKPTCIGVTSYATFELLNTSRTPLNFSWNLLGESRDQFEIRPPYGFLQGNDSVEVRISYLPTRKGFAKLSARCDARPAGHVDRDWEIASAQASEWFDEDTATPTSALKLVYAESVEELTEMVSTRSLFTTDSAASSVQSVSVNVETEAGPGALQFSPTNVQFGALLVDTTRHRTITVLNRSDCTVHFRLGAYVDAFEQCLDSYEFYSRENDSRDPNACLVFEPGECTLQPHSSVAVTVSFTPEFPARYVIRAFYEILENSDTSQISDAASEQLKVSMNAAKSAARQMASRIANGYLVRMDEPPDNEDVLWCELIGCGAYPSVVLEDVRGLNSIESLLTFFPKPPARRGVPLLCQDADQEREGEALYYHKLNVNYGRDGVAFLANQVGSDRSLPERRDTSVPVGGDHQGGWLFPCTVGLPGDVHPLALPSSHTGQEKQAREEVGEVMSYQDLSSCLCKFLGLDRSKVPNVDSIQFKIHNSASASSRMWNQMSLQGLNSALSSPLTDKELQFNKATHDMDPATYLETIPLEFTPAPLGSPPQLVAFNVRNSSRLPANIDLRWEHDPDVDIEPWAATTEPTETEVRLRQLVDRRIFGVFPRQATLEPGEATTIYFFYSYVSTVSKGVHELPLIFRVFKGKQIRLVLRGRTLDPSAPYLYMTSPNRSYNLAAVPVGCVDPPRQPIKLINPTGIDVAFALDESSLEAYAHENHNFSVLRASLRPPFNMLKPSEASGEITEAVIQQLLSGRQPQDYYSGVERVGIIPAQSESTIWITFQPLEAKEYVCPLRIVYTYASTLKSTEGWSSEEVRMMASHLRRVDPSLEFFPENSVANVSVAETLPPLLEDIGDLTITLRGKGYNPSDYDVTTLRYDDPRGVPDLGIGAGMIRNGFSLGIIKEELAKKSNCVKKFKTMELSPSVPTLSRFSAMYRAGSATLDRWYSSLLSVTGMDNGSDDGFAPLDHEYSQVRNKTSEGRYSWLPVSNRAAEEVRQKRCQQRASHEAFLSRMDMLVRHSNATQSELFQRPNPAKPNDPRITASEDTVTEYLSGTNYRPGEEPQAKFGGFQAPRRYVDVSQPWIPESYVSIFGEDVQFGDVSTSSVSQRIIILRNTRSAEALGEAVHSDYVKRAKELATEKSEQQDKTVNEQGGEGKSEAPRMLLKGEEYSITMERNVGDGSGPVVFCWDMTNPLVRSGVIRIQPARGVIEPEGCLVVRVTLHSPPKPCVIDSDIALAVGMTMDELRSHASAIIKTSQERSKRSRSSKGGNGAPDPVHVSVAMKSTFSRSKSVEELQKAKTAKAGAVSEQNRQNTAEAELVTQSHAPLEALQGQADIASMMARILAPTEIMSPEFAGTLLRDPNVLCAMSLNIPELRTLESSSSGKSREDSITKVTALEDKSVGNRMLELPLTKSSVASLRRIEGASNQEQIVENLQQLNPSTVYGTFLPHQDARSGRRMSASLTMEGSSAISGTGTGKGTLSGSRTGKSKSDASLQQFMHLPGVPRGRLYMHVGARICSDSEFLDTHGRYKALSMKKFESPAPQSPERLLRTLGGKMEVEDELKGITQPQLHDAESAAVVTDVVTDMLADVVADKSIAEEYRVSRQTTRRSAKGSKRVSQCSLRQLAIQEDECAEITSRCLESTILNLCKEIVSGDFAKNF